jgi:hypothetical protein
VRAGAGERSGKREREIGGRHTQNGQWIYGALTSRLERDAADMETKNSSGRVATPAAVSELIAERDLHCFEVDARSPITTFFPLLSPTVARVWGVCDLRCHTFRMASAAVVCATALAVAALAVVTIAAHSPPPPSQAEADAWSQSYRGWSYSPDWVLPPSCIDRATCKAPYVNVSGAFTDIFQVWRLPVGEDGPLRASAAALGLLLANTSSPLYVGVYTFYDGIGYQTAWSLSQDLVTFTQILSPTGILFSPRTSWASAPGQFDFGGAAFVGPILADYNVTAPRVLQRVNGKFWYAYFGQPTRNALEPPPGATGLASSVDGLTWVRETEVPILDVEPAHGAMPWEGTQVYAPFLLLQGGTVTNIYNARGAPMNEFGEQSGLATLDASLLPGINATTNASLWTRFAGNPVLRDGTSFAGNETFDTEMTSDPKLFWDASLDGGKGAWVVIYFGLGPTSGGGAAICIAFSRDGVEWSKASTPLYKPGGHPGGLDKCHAHKAWLTVDETGRKHLFYTGDDCNGRGILLLTSTPLDR